MTAFVTVPGQGASRLEHSAFSYHSDSGYAARVRAFLEPAIGAAAPILVAVPPSQLRLLRAELAAAPGPIHFEDMCVAGRNPGRIIPGLLLPFAEAHPDRRVWIIGESMWPMRSADEYSACMVHEALVNVALAEIDATILCAYNARMLRPPALRDAVRTHPQWHRRAGRASSRIYADPVLTAAGFAPPLPVPPEGAVVVGFADDRALAGLRRVAAQHAEQAGLSPDQVAAVELIVTELAANTIEHSPGPGRLTVWTADGRLVLQVDDTGYITDPLAGRVVPGLDDEGGRGLLLTHELSDLVLLHTGPRGTSVRVHFALQERL